MFFQSYMKGTTSFSNVDVITVHTGDLVDNTFHGVLMGTLDSGKAASQCVSYQPLLATFTPPLLQILPNFSDMPLMNGRTHTGDFVSIW